MNLPIECIKAALEEAPRPPAVLAVEGMLGAGKTTISSQLIEQLGARAVIFGMDAFIRISRRRMDEMLARGPIVLEDWYDLEKVAEGIEAAKRQEKFAIDDLYNLADGEFNRRLEFDATGVDLIIVEGLLSMHPRFDPYIDASLFIDILPETALARAEQRDYAERNLTPEQWRKKLLIYWEGYKLWMERFRASAQFIYDPQAQTISQTTST
jgi:uridine kinase